MIVPPGFTVRRYEVSGERWSDVRLSVEALGPRRGAARFIAFTDWDVGWIYDKKRRDAGFSVASLRVRLGGTVTIPSLSSEGAPASLVDRWMRFEAAIIEHERGHLAFAVEAKARIEAALKGLSPAPSIGALDDRAGALTRAIIDEIRARERSYDKDTRGGAAQGVTWD